MTDQHSWCPLDFDGLVVESATGDRLLALPVSVLEILRHATIVRFRRGDSIYSMSLTDFGPANSPTPPSTSAPTPEYGAPALPVHGALDPSPAPPPVLEADPLDPANVPLRVHRRGKWKTIYVTGEQYTRATSADRIRTIEEGDQQ